MGERAPSSSPASTPGANSPLRQPKVGAVSESERIKLAHVTLLLQVQNEALLHDKREMLRKLEQSTAKLRLLSQAYQSLQDKHVSLTHAFNLQREILHSMSRGGVLASVKQALSAKGESGLRGWKTSFSDCDEAKRHLKALQDKLVRQRVSYARSGYRAAGVPAVAKGGEGQLPTLSKSTHSQPPSATRSTQKHQPVTSLSLL